MKKSNILETKSITFALRIIKLSKYLQKRKESVIAKQVLRSGTSIGANVAEAGYAQSKDDFASKLAIAAKEASETRYWLILLSEGGLVGTDELPFLQTLAADCEELLRLLVSSVKTVKTRSSRCN